MQLKPFLPAAANGSETQCGRTTIQRALYLEKWLQTVLSPSLKYLDNMSGRDFNRQKMERWPSTEITFDEGSSRNCVINDQAAPTWYGFVGFV